MTILHESKFWILNLNPEKNILELFWKNPGNSEPEDEDFKAHLILLVKFIEEYKIKSFLVDGRSYHVVMSVHLQDWHDKVTVPEYIKNGVKKISFISPEDVFAAATIEQSFEEDNAKNIEVKYFDTEDQARDWLEN